MEPGRLEDPGPDPQVQDEGGNTVGLSRDSETTRRHHSTARGKDPSIQPLTRTPTLRSPLYHFWCATGPDEDEETEQDPRALGTRPSGTTPRSTIPVQGSGADNGPTIMFPTEDTSRVFLWCPCLTFPLVSVRRGRGPTSGSVPPGVPLVPSESGTSEDRHPRPPEVSK